MTMNMWMMAGSLGVACIVSFFLGKIFKFLSTILFVSFAVYAVCAATGYSVPNLPVKFPTLPNVSKLSHFWHLVK